MFLSIELDNKNEVNIKGKLRTNTYKSFTKSMFFPLWA